MTSNELPEPSALTIARYKFLLELLLKRKLFTDAELREYHRLSTVWTTLFNGRHKGVLLTENQLKFMDVKRKEMFRRSVKGRDRKWAKFWGFRSPKNFTINQ